MERIPEVSFLCRKYKEKTLTTKIPINRHTAHKIGGSDRQQEQYQIQQFAEK